MVQIFNVQGVNNIEPHHGPTSDKGYPFLSRIFLPARLTQLRLYQYSLVA